MPPQKTGPENGGVTNLRLIVTTLTLMVGTATLVLSIIIGHLDGHPDRVTREIDLLRTETIRKLQEDIERLEERVLELERSKHGHNAVRPDGVPGEPGGSDGSMAEAEPDHKPSAALAQNEGELR